MEFMDNKLERIQKSKERVNKEINKQNFESKISHYTNNTFCELSL